MPLSSDQLARRPYHLGGSDIGEILYGDGYRVWAEKTGKATVPDEPNEAMQLGNDCEPGLLRWAEKWHGAGPMEINVQVPHIELPWIETQVDGLLVARAEPNDAKTTGLVGRAESYHLTDAGVYVGWGEAGTDQVPDRALAQVMAQIACCRSQYRIEVAQGWLPTLIGGRGRLMFRIEWNDGLWEAMVEELCHFWFDHVQRDIPPEESQPTWEVVRHFKVREGTYATMDADVVNLWLAAKKLAGDAVKEAEALKARIVAASGGAEYVIPEGALPVHITYSSAIIPEKIVPEHVSDRKDVREIKQVPENVKLVAIEKKGK